MKKLISYLFASIIAVCFNTFVVAHPITHQVDFICPIASNLSNFGTYIAGFGSEILSSSLTNKIYFKSGTSLRNIPNFLGNYINAGTSYSHKGYVLCKFTSINPAESSFTVLYHLTNGKGGQIQSRTRATIRVLFLLGLSK